MQAMAAVGRSEAESARGIVSVGVVIVRHVHLVAAEQLGLLVGVANVVRGGITIDSEPR